MGFRIETVAPSRLCECGHAAKEHIFEMCGTSAPCRDRSAPSCGCRDFTLPKKSPSSSGRDREKETIQGKNGICKCGHYEDIHRWSGGCCSALGCACQGFVEFKLVDPAQPPGRNHAWEAKPECPLSGHPRFYEILDRLKDLHSRKAAAYEGTNPPYTNYKRAGERWFGGRTGAVRYALMRLEEKLERIRNLILDETLPASSESLNDNLEDIAVIAIIAEILYEELADGKVEK